MSQVSREARRQRSGGEVQIKKLECRSWHCGRQGRGKLKKKDFRSKLQNKEDFRSWHCGRQAGGSLNRELDFASWHCGRQGGSSNKELEYRSWHCGRQGGEV